MPKSPPKKCRFGEVVTECSDERQCDKPNESREVCPHWARTGRKKNCARSVWRFHSSECFVQIQSNLLDLFSFCQSRPAYLSLFQEFCAQKIFNWIRWAPIGIEWSSCLMLYCSPLPGLWGNWLSYHVALGIHYAVSLSNKIRLWANRHQFAGQPWFAVAWALYDKSVGGEPFSVVIFPSAITVADVLFKVRQRIAS